MTSLASFRAREASISPSAAITLARASLAASASVAMARCSCTGSRTSFLNQEHPFQLLSFPIRLPLPVSLYHYTDSRTARSHRFSRYSIFLSRFLLSIKLFALRIILRFRLSKRKERNDHGWKTNFFFFYETRP